jgi:hypothetical protein
MCQGHSRSNQIFLNRLENVFAKPDQKEVSIFALLVQCLLVERPLVEQRLKCQ